MFAECSGSALEREVIDDLASYIRALDDGACDPAATEAQSWQSEVRLVRAGLASKSPLGANYKDAMRAALGRIYERFPAHADIRDELIALSRRIEADTDASKINAALDDLSVALAEAEPVSLYNPEPLARALR